MWQIKYQGEFLDIKSEQSAEIERVSPLFIIEQLLEEASTPIELADSEINNRKLGYIFFDKTSKAQVKIDVEIYTPVNGVPTFRSNATMIVESAAMNSRHNRTASCTGYLLIGISNFFSTIQDIKLTELTLGGDRVFNHTTEDPLDASDGYWQHAQATMDGTYDYIFPMFINNAFNDEDIEFTYSDFFVNRYYNDSILTQQALVPWPKLSYVLKQIFSEHGWTLDTSLIDGTGWEKLFLYSLLMIRTCYFNWGGSSIVTTPKTSITINLAQAMPQDINCSSFVFAICKRYFWAPICDLSTNTCLLLPLKNVRSLEVEDWTEYAQPASNSNFSLAARIFSFKNNFVGDDQYPTSLDISAYSSYATVNSFGLLPDLVDSAYDNHLYYVFTENTFYTVLYDVDSNTRSWVIVGHNIYNVEPENATDVIETDVTTLPSKRKLLPDGHYGFVSVVEQEKNTKWGIRTVLYHGLVKQIGESDEPLDITYPCAIATNTPPALLPQLPWSNVWNHNDFTKDWGIIPYWGQKWLDALLDIEDIERYINLPFHNLVNFKWQTIKIIDNIPHLVKSYVESTENRKQILCKLRKVNLVNYAVEEIPTFDPNARFNGYIVTDGSRYLYVATQYVKGSPGAVVEITVIAISESDPAFYEKLNGSDVLVGYTINVTLDSNGDGSFNVRLGGVSSDGEAVMIRLQITDTSIAAIGSPDIAQHDKITG